MERPFIVHRTMCDVRWIDPTVDPNDRPPGWTYLGDPRTVNVGPAGLPCFTTLRSWLSQWSITHSQARGAVNAARITKKPALQVENSADDAVSATHNQIVCEALGTPDATYHLINNATHYYYKGQPTQLQECLGVVENWCRDHGLLAHAGAAS